MTVLNAFQTVRPRLPDSAPGARPKPLGRGADVVLRGSRPPRLLPITQRPGAVPSLARRPSVVIVNSATTHRDADRRNAMRQARI